jgi:membrane protease YdiL (CAAX protease family)
MFDARWPSIDIRSLLPAPIQFFLGLGVLVALWLVGMPAAKYCGLARPRGRDVLLGMTCTAAFQLTTFGLLFLLGVQFSPAGMTLRSVLGQAVRTVIFAPVLEEILFRGFAYQRLVQSRLGIVGAIVVTPVAWALIHLDPMHLAKGSNPIFIPFIFFLGLLFGWLRERSGSTVLTVLVHTQWNLISYVVWLVLALR